MKKFILFLALITLWSTPNAFANVLNIQEVTSKSGIRAWLVEDKSVPVISMQFLFKGAGARNDPPEYQGLSRLLSNTMDEGAGDLTSTEFQKKLSQYSIGLSFSAGRDDFAGSLKTLTKYKDTAFDLLRLSLSLPRFDKDAVQRMIDSNISRIRDDMSDPEWMAGRIENDVIFTGHPYAQNAGGTLSSLPKITPDLLREKWKKDLTRDRLIIAVVGDISPIELATQLDYIFSSLSSTSTKNSLQPVDLRQNKKIILYKHDMPQTILSIVGQGVAQTDKDYFAAEVMNYIFGGGGFGSRLTDVIREKKGLTYGIYTQFSEMDLAQIFRINISAQNKNIQNIIDEIANEIDRIKTKPVSDTELKNAKSYLIGSTTLQLSSTDRIAGMMLSFQKWGLPKNYLDIRQSAILRVTDADIQRVAQKYLDMDRFTYIMVGNPDTIKVDKKYTQLPNVE
jgi:zinc protease